MVSDAHSHNLVLTKVGGDLTVVVVYGKAAGVTKDVSFAVWRLAIKLRQEMVPEHRWLLLKYKNYLQQQSD